MLYILTDTLIGRTPVVIGQGLQRLGCEVGKQAYQPKGAQFAGSPSDVERNGVQRRIGEYIPQGQLGIHHRYDVLQPVAHYGVHTAIIRRSTTTSVGEHASHRTIDGLVNGSGKQTNSIRTSLSRTKR